MNQNILLEQIRDRYYRKETGLIYDWISSFEPAKRFEHLPNAEEISRQIPNPCGWGTGMEDSALHGGMMLAALCHRDRDEDTGFSERLFDGMRSLGTVHGKRGFVARSISPRDGKSCYINSSRDQYTLFVYGLWRFYQSGRKQSGQRAEIRSLLTGIAEYCENRTEILRLDGRPGLVSRLTGRIGLHEILRPAMFFAAASAVSGDRHWLECCRESAAAGIPGCLRLDAKQDWWYMELYQMTLSLLLLAETDTENADTYRFILKQAGELSIRKLRDHRVYWETRRTEDAVSGKSWRCLPLKLCHYDSESSVLYEGYPYYCPCYPDAFSQAQEKWRELGQMAAVAALTGYAPEAREYFAKQIDGFDPERHATGAPMSLFHAAVLLNL